MSAPVTRPLAAGTVRDVHEILKKSILSPATTPGVHGVYANDAAQRTYVENPYEINRTGINKAPAPVLRQVGKIDPAPGEYLLSDADWKKKLNVRFPDPTLKPHESESREQRAKTWLESAKVVAERPALPGFCNLFAMVTVVLLVADDSPLDSGILVEWIGSGDPARGHMAVAVNREPASDIAQVDDWGANYLIIDYWYGLQTGTGPIFRPRTKAGIDGKAPADLDEHDIYRRFFDDQGTARVRGSFTARAYSPLKVRAKPAGTF